MDALHQFGFHRRMALGTGAWDIELEDGGFLVAGAANFVNAVAIGADRGFGGAVGHGLSMHALLVGIELLRRFAGALHNGFLGVAGGAGGGNFFVIKGSFGMVGSDDRRGTAVATQAGRSLHIAILAG